jgi:uncharacterized protein (DUF2384 family)
MSQSKRPAEEILIDALQLALEAYFEVEEAAQWMTVPQPVLGGKIPSDLVLAGEGDEVLAVVARLCDPNYLSKASNQGGNGE